MFAQDLDKKEMLPCVVTEIRNFVMLCCLSLLQIWAQVFKSEGPSVNTSKHSMMLTQFFKNVGKHIDKLRLRALLSGHNLMSWRERLCYAVDWWIPKRLPKIPWKLLFYCQWIVKHQEHDASAHFQVCEPCLICMYHLSLTQDFDVPLP